MHVCFEEAVQNGAAEHRRAAFKNEVSQKGHQNLRGPYHTQGSQDPFPQGHPGRSAHCAVRVNVWKAGKCCIKGCVCSVHPHSPCPHGSVCKNMTKVIHYIVRTQPAEDTSEETVRSIMKVHRCHRLHTKKEERVMLLLVSAYLVLGLQCMPRDVFLLNSTGEHHQKC